MNTGVDIINWHVSRGPPDNPRGAYSKDETASKAIEVEMGELALTEEHSTEENGAQSGEEIDDEGSGGVPMSGLAMLSIAENPEPEDMLR